MGSRLRAWLERRLSWFDPGVERLGDIRAAARTRRAIAAENQAEQIIEAYRLAARASDDAAEVADDAAERVISEVQRKGDE